MRPEIRERLEKLGIKVRLMTPEEAASTGVLMYSIPRSRGTKNDPSLVSEESKEQEEPPDEES